MMSNSKKWDPNAPMTKPPTTLSNRQRPGSLKKTRSGHEWTRMSTNKRKNGTTDSTDRTDKTENGFYIRAIHGSSLFHSCLFVPFVALSFSDAATPAHQQFPGPVNVRRHAGIINTPSAQP